MIFKSSVTHFVCTATDFHHKRTYGTPSTLTCNYSKMDKVVKDNVGKDILTIAWLQFPVGTIIVAKDKIILPDGTTAPVIIPGRIIHYPHTNVEMCVECYIGKESI